MRILLVEDDESVVEVVTELLQKNYVVDLARDGEIGWELFNRLPYDLVLLDVKLPKLDGLSFCRRLRQQNNPVPVILLTAQDTTTDKLIGLDSGADDYIIKPFNIQELAARIRALLRRGSTAITQTLSCGDLSLNPQTHQVTFRDQPLQFSRKEYLLLELFLRNQQRIYSCREIVNHLWSLEVDSPNDTTIRSHIKNIRRQLKAVGAGDLFETLYGQGYRINPAFLASSQAAPSTTAKTERLNCSVKEIWDRTRDNSFERLVFLEQVLRTLKSGLLDPPLQQQALQTAHKLVGSLGMFGSDRGTGLARQIEHLLQINSLSENEIDLITQSLLAQRLEPLIVALRQEVEGFSGHIEPIAASTAVTPLPERLTAKILAVDDDPEILATLKNVLEPLGAQLTCLEKSDQFWQILTLFEPDLLILDINIPGKSGIQLCQLIRQNPAWSWLPILFLTAYSETEMQQQAFVVGADDYVSKPIIPRDLVIRICNRFQRSRVLLSQSHSN